MNAHLSTNKTLLISFLFALFPQSSPALDKVDIILGIEEAKLDLLSKDIAYQYSVSWNYKTDIQSVTKTVRSSSGRETVYTNVLSANNGPTIVSESYVRTSTYEYVAWANGSRYISIISDQPAGKALAEYEIDGDFYRKTGSWIDVNNNTSEQTVLVVKKATEAPGFRNPIVPLLVVGYLNLAEDDISRFDEIYTDQGDAIVQLTCLKKGQIWKIKLIKGPTGYLPLEVQLIAEDERTLYSSVLDNYKHWEPGLWLPSQIEETYAGQNTEEMERKIKYLLTAVKEIDGSRTLEKRIKMENPYILIDEVSGISQKYGVEDKN